MTYIKAASLALFILFLQPTYATNPSSIERGALFFTQHCSGCHALKYLQYSSKPQYQALATISMPRQEAQQWFGKAPPDLSLTARARGVSWLYAYLTGFYADQSRPFGDNNRLITNVAMPNVLESFHGHELNANVQDVIAFLSDVAEPTKSLRYRVGAKVLLFLAIFAGLIFCLKRKNKNTTLSRR